MVKTLHEEEAETPLGDWQTESKGVVRIAQCGAALCGYTLNPSSNDKGEAVLINMKPKTDTRWTGSVYSKDSGDTYYGTVDHEGTEHAARRSLRVRPVLLLGQQLDPDIGKAHDDVAAAGIAAAELEQFPA